MICSISKDDCRKPRVPSLPDRNEKARFRIRPVRAALTTSREVHPEVPPLRRRIVFAGGDDAVCPKTKGVLPCSTNYSQPPQLQPWHLPSLPPTPRESKRAAAAII